MRVADFFLSIPGLYTGGTPCRVRLFRVNPHPVMVVTALKANMGLTNMIEYVAAQVAIDHRDLFPDGQRFACIEHYPAENQRDTYYGVVFASYRVGRGWREGEERRRLGAPQWIPMTQDVVEEVIGEALAETMQEHA